jgi:hypothetical protein
MEYVPITTIPECIHRGKVLLKKLKHPLRINGIEVLTAEAVDGARVACPVANPALRCTCVTGIVIGRSAKLRSHPRLTPLLATAEGTTDRGTWSIPGGGSVLRVGGGNVPAPAVCTVQPAPTPAGPTAAGKSRAKPPTGLKLVLKLKPGTIHQEVERKIAVHVVAVQGDKVFATALAARPGLPTDGSVLELVTELDPAQPVWITATTHPRTNGVWSVEPEGAPRPLVFVPKTIAARLNREPGSGRWKRSWKQLAAAAGRGIDAKTLARANGIDPTRADAFAGWVVVRAPVKRVPKGGSVEVVLEPLYPRLLAALRAERALAAAVGVVRARYHPTALDRLRVAARCEEIFRTLGHKMLGTFAEVGEPELGGVLGSLAKASEASRSDAVREPRTLPRHALILDAHNRHRRSDAVLEVARKARAVADALTAAPAGAESFAAEFARFQTATSRCLLWCARGGAGAENPDAYSAAARRNEAVRVFDTALARVRGAVRFLAELDQVGQFARNPVLGPEELDRWSEWFDRFADTVFAVPVPVPDTPDPAALPADRLALWTAALGWGADSTKSVLTGAKWLIGEQKLLVDTATDFELFAGARRAGSASVLDRFVSRLERSNIDISARGGHTYRIGTVPFKWTNYKAMFVDVATTGKWAELHSAAVTLETSKLGQRQAALVLAVSLVLLYQAYKRETADPAKLPAPEHVLPTELSDWLTIAGLLNKGVETGVYRYAKSVAVRDIAGLEANAAAKLSRTKWALKAFKGAGYVISGASAVSKFFTAYDDVKAGNINKANVCMASGLVSLGFLVFPPGLAVDILTSLGFGMLEQFFTRSELEDKLADVVRETEFGANGEKRSRVYVPDPLLVDEVNRVGDEYLAATDPDPTEDLLRFHDFYVCAACRAQVLTVRGRPRLGEYPAAGLWLWPQPGRASVRADFDIKGVPGVPPRVRIRATHTGWDAKGDRVLSVRVRMSNMKLRSAKPIPEGLVNLTAFRTDLPSGPAVPTAFAGETADGDRVLYATLPLGYSELDLGTVALAADRRLLVVLAPDDLDTSAHVGSEVAPTIDFCVLIDGPVGSRKVKGWTTDKPVTATVTTVADKVVLRLL